MTPWTALLLAGLAVAVLLQSGRPSRTQVWSGRGIAVAAGVVAVVFLLEYATGRSFGVDRVLFRDAVGVLRGTWPGRPSPRTSWALVLLAVTIALQCDDRRWAGLLRAVGLLGALTMGSVTVGAYLFGALSLVTVTPSTGMGISTAICVVVLAFAAVLVRPDRKPVSWLLARPDRTALLQLLGVTVGTPVLVAVLSQLQLLYGANRESAWVTSLLAAVTCTGLAAFVIFERERRRRTESEGQLRSIMDHAPNAIAIRNLHGELIFANQRGRDLLNLIGTESAGRTPGEPGAEGESVRKVSEAESAAIRGEVAAFELDFSGGKTLAFQLFPVRNEVGRIFGFGAIGTDVSERVRVAESMRQAAEAAAVAAQRAEAANRAKSDFLATMSHELRTPLNSILGFSDLLRRDSTLSSHQRDDLDIINRSGAHLLGLINQVLDMAKIESGRTDLEVVAVDLPALIEDVDLMMRGRAEAAGLRFGVDVADDLPRYVRCDAQKVRQIIVNLLGNSMKFTTEGAVSLRVKATSAEPLRLLIEIEDSGAGIPEDQRQRIFEPFVQLQQSGTPGTGLGLSLVQEYLRLMGGSVEVTGNVGVGSLFRVSIPIWEARAQDVPSSIGSKRVVGLAPGQPQWRVLIVEDEPLNRLLLGRLLEEVGFVVAFADNGAQCLQVFAEFGPHFIWMDRRMPVMDGLEATLCLRGRPDGREVKIAALTASVFEEQRDEWIGAGIDGFVRKPFLETEIFECMARVLGVEYVYQAAAEELPAQLTIDLSTDLAKLPDALRVRLADALVLGSTDGLDAVLGQIREISPELANALQPYFQDFNYEPVLDALGSSK